jgi:cell division protein ZapA
MDERLQISIKIAGLRHPLRVKPEDEEIVRKAAAMVDQKYEEYCTRYKGADLPPDYVMTFVAVDLAAKYLRQDADNNAASTDAELEQLAAQLRQYLNQ